MPEVILAMETALMIEIFTTVAGDSNSTARVFSNDIRIGKPSDVHFGSGAAGIAFYEKSGADLKVTLLDGQEVMIRDFFVIGEAGQYSRLRDGGASGDIEVTGLIAPEPYVPPGVTQTATTDSVLPEADSVSTGALSDPEALPAPAAAAAAGDGGGAAPASTVPQGAASSAGNTFGGISFDQIAFGLSMLPAAGLILRSDKHDEEPPAGTLHLPGPAAGDDIAADGDAAAGPGAGADADTSADSGAGTDAEGDHAAAAGDAPMAADLAALIQSIVSGDSAGSAMDDQPVTLFGADFAGTESPSFGGADPLHALFDPMHFISIEG